MTAEFAGNQYLIEALYLVASILFILSLKWLSAPSTARHGVLAGSHNRLAQILGTIAVVAATSNIVGGFIITDRMLKMFKLSRTNK